MIRINHKPMTVNQAWQGKRFKTEEYKNYSKILMLKFLPQTIELPEPPYLVYYNFGFSSPLSDWDNPIKPFQDIIAAKYGFNDKLIKKAIIEIFNVKKGEEFIEFKIEHLVR